MVMRYVCVWWLGVGSAVTAPAPARRRKGRGRGRTRKARDTSEILPQPAPNKVTCGKITLTFISLSLFLHFLFLSGFILNILLNLSVCTLTHLFVILHSSGLYRFSSWPFFCSVCGEKNRNLTITTVPISFSVSFLWSALFSSVRH